MNTKDIKDIAERFATLVADEIKKIANERGTTQLQLSKDSGISQGQISRLYRHERAISVDQLDALSRALGTRASNVLRTVENNLYVNLSVVEDSLENPDEYGLAAHTGEEEPEQ